MQDFGLLLVGNKATNLAQLLPGFYYSFGYVCNLSQQHDGENEQFYEYLLMMLHYCRSLKGRIGRHCSQM